MPKGTGRPDNRDERNARESQRDSGSQSAATKSKQADLQSFGATPPGSQPTREEARALGNAIDRMNEGQSGFGGFLNDVFGIRQEVALNPNTNQYDVKSYKEINPLETAVGLLASSALGPIAGQAVTAGMGMLGFEDPLGFEIDLGFGSETTKTKRDPEKDRSDREKTQTASTSKAVATGQQSQEKSAIDKAIEELLEGKNKFQFFDMPQFKLLDPKFGHPAKEINLASMLLGGNQEESA